MFCEDLQYDVLGCTDINHIFFTTFLHMITENIVFGSWFCFFFFSSTTLLLPTHLPPPLCTHAQSCNPMDFSPPDSSVHGLFQARRILEWVAISFSIGSCFYGSKNQRKYVFVYIQIHTYMCIYMCVCVYICHIHTHTHAQTHIYVL